MQAAVLPEAVGQGHENLVQEAIVIRCRQGKEKEEAEAKLHDSETAEGRTPGQ